MYFHWNTISIQYCVLEMCPSWKMVSTTVDLSANSLAIENEWKKKRWNKKNTKQMWMLSRNVCYVIQSQRSFSSHYGHFQFDSLTKSSSHCRHRADNLVELSEIFVNEKKMMPFSIDGKCKQNAKGKSCILALTKRLEFTWRNCVWRCVSVCTLPFVQ